MAKHWMARAVLGRTSVGNPLDQDDRPDAQFEAEWRRQMKMRLLFVLGVLGLWGVALEARLVFLQVVAHEEFAARAKQQQQNILEPEAGRGDILDRNGEVLAYSVGGYRVIADPSRVEDPAREAQQLCAVLGDCSADERSQITARLGKKGRYAVVREARFVSPDAAGRIQELIKERVKAGHPAVVSLIPESRRYYPKLDLASQVVGFVGDQGRGVEGIESQFDKRIAGAKGRVLVQVDGQKSQREIATVVERAPTAGATLELTISLALQHIAERELRAGVEEFDAVGGSVVILQPFTGEILAEASWPTFNPNAYWKASDDARRNRVVSDTYEPGSTFKIVTASAAINEGLLSPSDLIDTSPGILKFAGRKPIREAQGHNYGVLSFEDVLIKSSNIGAIRVGQRIGADRLYQYVRGFGFGQSLAPDFGSRVQSRGQVKNLDKVDDSSLASMSMGYEIGVTPLQVAAAMSVVANGGLLMEPRVLRAVISNGRREVVEPKVLRRVITAETAATMTTIMEGVTERGTGKAAALGRYRVAGKTGTANKVVNNSYSETDFNVSFGGFVPSRQPALTILVVIDTPRRGQPYGGTIAAPIFRRIAEAAMQQLGVPPSINPAPPIIMATGRHVLPLEPTRSAAVIPTITRVGDRPVMPDVRGMSLRDALRVTQALGLSMTWDGDGVVASQSPAPGEFVEPDGTGALQLRRLSAPGRSGR